jgi:dTDP-4-amino-4,6-dideoxygalactose transaminase
MVLLRSHGITRDPKQMTREPDGPWYYQQIELGFNYRMTDIQAALGISQMDRLDAFVARRHELASEYERALEGLAVTALRQSSEGMSSLHLYVIRLQKGIGEMHRSVFEGLKGEGIGVNLHYIPVHLQPYYSKLGFSIGDFPESETYYNEAITLPLYPSMTEKEQRTVIRALQKCLSRF